MKRSSTVTYLFTFSNVVGGDDEGHSPHQRYSCHPQEECATELRKIEHLLATGAPRGALQAQLPCDPRPLTPVALIPRECRVFTGGGGVEGGVSAGVGANALPVCKDQCPDECQSYAEHPGVPVVHSATMKHWPGDGRMYCRSTLCTGLGMGECTVVAHYALAWGWVNVLS